MARPNPDLPMPLSPFLTVNEVVAALDAWHGREVRVLGNLRVEFEGTSLWHIPRGERLPGYGSSLRVEFDWAPLGMTLEQIRAFDGRRVLVYGRVDRLDTGHLGPWPGALRISDIVRSGVRTP